MQGCARDVWGRALNKLFKIEREVDGGELWCRSVFVCKHNTIQCTSGTELN